MNQRKWLGAFTSDRPALGSAETRSSDRSTSQWIAMARRAPVTASATGGILGVVVQGETAHLVPIDADPSTDFSTYPSVTGDFAARVTALLQSKAKAGEMGEAGCRQVEEHFSWTATARCRRRNFIRMITARKK